MNEFPMYKYQNSNELIPTGFLPSIPSTTDVTAQNDIIFYWNYCFLHKISNQFNKSYIHPAVRIIFMFNYLHCHCLTNKAPTP